MPRRELIHLFLDCDAFGKGNLFKNGITTYDGYLLDNGPILVCHYDLSLLYSKYIFNDQSHVFILIH